MTIVVGRQMEGRRVVRLTVFLMACFLTGFLVVVLDPADLVRFAPRLLPLVVFECSPSSPFDFLEAAVFRTPDRLERLGTFVEIVSSTLTPRWYRTPSGDLYSFMNCQPRGLRSSSGFGFGGRSGGADILMQQSEQVIALMSTPTLNTSSPHTLQGNVFNSLPIILRSCLAVFLVSRFRFSAIKYAFCFVEVG